LFVAIAQSKGAASKWRGNGASIGRQFGFREIAISAMSDNAGICLNSAAW
jgi:hypothetical protein